MPLRVNLSAGFAQTQSTVPGGWRGLAREAEAIGYETLVVADHLVAGGAAPFTTMAAAAAVTERLRVGTYVLNNDLRHPVVVAHEVAALAELSSGRVTLGLGAGHMRSEYEAAGIAFDPAGRRVSRMIAAADVIARLLAGETVTHASEHYRVTGHAVRDVEAPFVRLLIGGNGTRVLQAAGCLAHTVGITGFTLTADGSGSDLSHFPDVGLAERISAARRAADERWPLPVDVLVQMVVVIDRASVTVFANRPHTDQTERTMAPIIEALG